MCSGSEVEGMVKEDMWQLRPQRSAGCRKLQNSHGLHWQQIQISQSSEHTQTKSNGTQVSWNKVELGHPVSWSRTKVSPLWLVCCLFVVRGRGPALGGCRPEWLLEKQKGARVGTAGERATAALWLLLAQIPHASASLDSSLFPPLLSHTHTHHTVPSCSPVPVASSVFH